MALGGRAPWQEALLLPCHSAVYAFQCLPSWYLCRSFPLQANGLLNAARRPGSCRGHIGGPLAAGWRQWARFFRKTGLRRSPGSLPQFLSTPLCGRCNIILLTAAAKLSADCCRKLTGGRTADSAIGKSLPKEAELRALKAQLDPHFLFNSLNSVMALIGSDTREAQRLCLLLSDFLRRA